MQRLCLARYDMGFLSIQAHEGSMLYVCALAHRTQPFIECSALFGGSTARISHLMQGSPLPPPPPPRLAYRLATIRHVGLKMQDYIGQHILHTGGAQTTTSTTL